MKCFDVKKFFIRWRGRLAVLAVLVFSVWALWCIPPWLVEQVLGEPVEPVELASLEDAYRRTLAQILGGLALLYGLYLTQRRIVATEDNVRVAQETVRVTEEGHLTDRFTKAIEQLENDKMAIRLGGIYALERIAKDSEKDHGPIMEVLTAYVRENAAREGRSLKETYLEPTTDIQAILTVLSRRETTGKNRGNDPLDLSGTHLHRVVIPPHGNLSGANLSGANLNRANLNGVNLDGANLSGANLLLALLDGANLSGADLNAADLNETKLSESENLTAEQVLSAKNWRNAHLPDYLKHLPPAHPAAGD